MLTFIDSIDNPLLIHIKDDPVRPEISKEFRVGKNRFVISLGSDQVRAMVCVSLVEQVPTIVSELEHLDDNIGIAVFYTIWSYEVGAGVELLFSTLREIQKRYPKINRFITLSPKTEMARRFHTKNGAIVLQENDTTVNYEYILK